MVPGWKKARFVVAAAALTTVMVACGDDDDDGGGAADTSAAGAETTAAEAAETTEAAAETTAAPDTTAAESDTTEASEGTEGGGGEVEQTLKVGFAWADVSAFEQASPAFGTGDPEEQIIAVLDALHADGTLPMNGVDVEFVPAAHDAIAADAQLAVCQQFGQDEEVFAALAGRDFPDGAECMASRFNTPIISVNQMPAALYEQAGPNLFTVKPDETTILTAFANWAIENGYLEGKTVGIYWETPAQAAVDAMRQILTDAGVNIASEVQSGGEGVGAEQDALAAQRFQADGVDMVIPIVGSSSIINFTAAAAEQGYNPGYIDTDWASHLADVATAAYAPGQYTDVPALASVRAGDLSVGLTPEAEECLANYEDFSGKTIPRTTPEQSGEYTNILITCDLANLLVAALEIATESGEEVTQESLQAAIEQITDFHGAYWDTISYSPDDHSGAKTGRQVRWNPDCPCWEPDGEWAPLPL
jgi:hypothetical protein